MPVRVAGGRRANRSEDPSANDRAYTKKGELYGTKRALQLMLWLFGIFENRIEGLDAKQPSERHSIDARLIGLRAPHRIAFPSSVLDESPAGQNSEPVGSLNENAGRPEIGR